MKLLKNKNWPGVKQSLIASVLFLIILDPLINLIKDVAAKGLVALVDYFFYSCGHFGSATFLCTIAILVFSTMVAQETKEVADSYKTVVSSNEKMEKVDKKSTHQSADNAADSFAEKTISEYKLKQKLKLLMFVFKGLYVFLTTMYILIFLFVTVYQCFPAVINETFDKTITQITPYVKEEKIEMMRSDWVSMKTKDDFDAINEELLRIREEHDLI